MKTTNLNNAFAELDSYIKYAEGFGNVTYKNIKGYIIPQCNNSTTLFVEFDLETFSEVVVIVADDTDYIIYICSNQQQADEFITELGGMSCRSWREIENEGGEE